MSNELQETYSKLIDNIIVNSNGCWIWQLSLRGGGYGSIICYNGAPIRTHRLSYAIFVADLVKGMHIDHLCRNRACCNPEHLEQVTPRENIHRGQAPTAINARKTLCKNGHPLVGENVKVYTFGNRITRRCLICTRQYARERYARVKN